jgi:long-chain acyl-CoA synthetase
MGDLGFWALAQQEPDHLAIVTPDGEELTAGTLLGRANQVVHALRGFGLKPGDVVATLLPNGVEYMEIYLACLQAGWYLVPINHHLVGPEVGYIVSDSGAKVFVAHERFQDAALIAAEEAEIASSTCLAVGEIIGFNDYTRLRDNQPTTLPEDRTLGDVMNYTSGTTGKPKGVYRKLLGVTPEQGALALVGILFLFGVQPQDDNVHIIGSPLYHTAVTRFGGASIHMGHTIVLMDKWTPEKMLQLIEQYKVTTSHMVPTQFHRLLELPEATRAKYDVSSLRHMIHAAAPCPVDTKRKMIEWWGDSIDEYYAASEGGGSVVSAKEWMGKPGTVGKAWPNSELAIFDDEGNRLETPGAIGTVYMAMANSSFEYHKDKEKTEKNRVGNFFTVGDIGYLDEDGFLFLCDRKSDMIISGGANIYPAEIEAVMQGHPKVYDVAVFGIPDDDWGERVHAVVQPAEGIAGDDALRDELLAYCADKLAKFKTPKAIDFKAELPRDESGKLYKRKLRDPFWEGREKAI